MLSDVWIRLRALFRRKTVEAELDAELRFHLDRQAEKYVQAGMTPEEARRRARLALGGIEQAKEECRDARGVRFLESLWQDVRYGARMLRKSPGFTLIAVLTLALGIGANTAIFSAVNGILLEPLPYANSARLVEIDARAFRHGFQFGGVSLPQIRDIQAQCPVLGQTAFYGGYGGVNLLGGSVPDRVLNGFVSGNFFATLGIRPLLGRPILPVDAKSGNERVVLLSYTLWKSDFGGDPAAIGKTITLAKEPFAIIGVTPPGLGLAILGRNRSLWRPLIPSVDFGTDRGSHPYNAIARLRPGVTLAEANSQLSTLSDRLATAYPKTDKGWKLSATSLKDATVGPTIPTELLILLAAVGLVLLIACVNVSGMLLARSWARHREVAVRLALGATRRQIIRQFLVESLLLSLAGGVLGLLLAFWAIPALRAIAPAGTPRLDMLRLDGNVLWFTLGVSMLGGILFGLAPALHASGHRVGASLKEGLGGLLAGFSARGPRRLRGALVVVEIALAMILATGASLVARSLENMMYVPLGYRIDHLLTVGAVLSGSACDPNKNPDLCYLATQEILRRLRALPGVEAATAADGAPLRAAVGTLSIDIEAGSQAKGARTNGPIMFDWAAPGYFRVMGIPLLAGRDFTDSDTSHSPRVAIVNQAFARRFFPGANPLGRRISTAKDKNGQPEWMEIIGEVADVHDFGITRPPPLEFYMPGTQGAGLTGFPTFLVRTAANPLALAAAVKQQIMSVDEDAPILNLKTVDQIIDESEAEPRFRASLLGAFGVLGVLLAMAGIYGVISYSVSRRTREIGLRMALGAQPSDALGMVIREAMALATVGIIIGIGGALALTRLLRSFLFQITPTDPATFAGVAVLLAAVALAACYVPARRAMRVDPMAALRHE